MGSRLWRGTEHERSATALSVFSLLGICFSVAVFSRFYGKLRENYGFSIHKFPIFQKMELEANDTHTTPTPRQDPQRERAARSDTHESPFPRDRALSRTSPGGSAPAACWRLREAAGAPAAAGSAAGGKRARGEKEGEEEEEEEEAAAATAGTAAAGSG